MHHHIYFWMKCECKLFQKHFLHVPEDTVSVTSDSALTYRAEIIDG